MYYIFFSFFNQSCDQLQMNISVKIRHKPLYYSLQLLVLT